MFHGLYAEAIPVLKRHLEMPGAVWQPERCASMRFLSRCYLSMGDRRQGMVWALRAIAEAPELREPWVQAQEAAYAAEDWEGVVYYGRRAVDITERSGFYINEDRAWGAYPWDAMRMPATGSGICGRQENTESRRCWRNRTTRGC